MSRLVDLYIYHNEAETIRFLILKRSDKVKYSGQWRMVGGKVCSHESADEAAIRELHEETNLQADLFWTLPSVNTFYEHQTDSIHHIPAFAAQVDPGKPIKLNHEHLEWQWIAARSIADYIFWPEQQRLMRLLASIINNNQLLDEWIIHDQRS